MGFKRRIVSLCFVFFVIFTWGVSANGSMTWPIDGEITSDYGYRTSPGGGIGSTNHRGIDIGGEYGQAVVAAASGVVTYASWGDGYGYYVEIDHGGGLVTGYGHNQEIVVDAGEWVQQGQTIAYCGSTGNSTGPHVHFEVCVNGEPQPPYDYLGIPYTGAGGLPQDEDVIPVDYSIFYSFAYSMGDLIGIVGAACTSGLGILQDAMMWLFILLITMDLAWAFTWSLFSSDGAEGMFEFLMKKLIVYGILMYCVRQWGVVIDAVRNYFVTSGALMFDSDASTAVAIAANPTEVVQKGMQLAAPYFNYVSSFSNSISVTLHLAAILIVFVLGLLIVAIFLLLGFQIMLAYMEFYITGLFSVISVTLGGFKVTREWPISHMGVNGLIASGIKLMWYTFFALMLSLSLQSLPDADFVAQSKGGDYETPANAYGAKGKYQILEENWPSWCVEAGLPPNAQWSPENQDTVAKFKMEQYYAMYGNWRDVAVAWNAGGAWVGSDDLPAETVDYLAKLEDRMQGVNTTFDIVAAMERFLYILVMALIGSRIGGLLMRTLCAGGGFRWSAG